jgi:hypothetical protein
MITEVDIIRQFIIKEDKNTCESIEDHHILHLPLYPIGNYINNVLNDYRVILKVVSKVSVGLWIFRRLIYGRLLYG